MLSLPVLRLMVLVLLLLAVGSNSQVVLDGVTIPKESCWVYIFIGHSNMSGRAPKRDTVTNPKLWNYRLHTTEKEWRLAKESIYIDKTINADKYSGPGMTFLNQMHQKYPDLYFGLFLNGEGRATVNTYVANKVIENRKLYEEIMTPLKEVVKGKVRIGGILAYLGIVEPFVGDTVACRKYATDMRNLAMLMRTELGDASIPFIVSQYEQEAIDRFSPLLPLPNLIMRQQDSLKGILSNCIVIPTNGIPLAEGDDHHWGVLGHDEFVRRMIDSLIIRGYAPPNPIVANEALSIKLPNKSLSFSVHPNPFANLIHIRTNIIGINFTVTITRINGELVDIWHSKSKKDFTISLNTVKSGVYFLSVKGNNTHKQTVRIVKL